MTEDIGSGAHREPSSATLEIAKLKERHIALKADVGDMRSTMSDIKVLLIGHIQNSDSRHAQLLATFNQHNLEDAVVHTKVLQIGTNLDALQTSVDNDKRSPVAIVLAVLSAIAAGATAWLK